MMISSTASCIGNKNCEIDRAARFSPDESATLNEVLENVNKLIESLNCVEKELKCNDERIIPGKRTISGNFVLSNNISSSGTQVQSNAIPGTLENILWESRANYVINDKALISRVNNSAHHDIVEEFIENSDGSAHYTNSCAETKRKINTDCHEEPITVKEISNEYDEFRDVTSRSCSQQSRELPDTHRNFPKYTRSSIKSQVNNDSQTEKGKSSSCYGALINREQFQNSEVNEEVGLLNYCTKQTSSSVEANSDFSEYTHTELTDLIRSSPTLGRKDRKHFENKGVLKKAVCVKERSEEKYTSPDIKESIHPETENAERSRNKLVGKLRSLGRTHRSLSLRRAFSRKFGSGIEKPKLKFTKSFPSDSSARNSEDCSCVKENELSVNLNSLSCFHQVKENDSAKILKRDLNHRKIFYKHNKSVTLPKTDHKNSPSIYRRAKSLGDTGGKRENFPDYVKTTPENQSERISSAGISSRTPFDFEYSEIKSHEKGLPSGKSIKSSKNICDYDTYSAPVTTVQRMRYHLLKSQAAIQSDSFPITSHEINMNTSRSYSDLSLFNEKTVMSALESGRKYETSFRDRNTIDFTKVLKLSEDSKDELEKSSRRSTVGSSYLREAILGGVKRRNHNKRIDETGNLDQKVHKTLRDSEHLFNSSHSSILKDDQMSKFDFDDNRTNGTPCLSSVKSHIHRTDSVKSNVAKNKLIFNKAFKSKSKTAIHNIEELENSKERTWKPKGNSIWQNMNGRVVELAEIDLLTLSESECDALQKVGLQRLTLLDLGVPVSVPKDESKLLKQKMSMKRKYAMHLSLSAKNKSKKEDHVFAIPLVQVVENDQLLRLQTIDQPNNVETIVNNEISAGNIGDNTHELPSRKTSAREAPDSFDSSSKTPSRSSSAENISSSSVISEVDSVVNEDGENTLVSPSTPTLGRKTPVVGGNSISRPLKRRDAIGADTSGDIGPYQSKLLESLMQSVTGTREKRSLLPPTMPQVPYVIQKCCSHIIKYGLNVTGIFRVAGSKKRVRQLRDEFDRGVDVKIDQDYNPHDVAALLKEFFRDLPEALLTRELYQPFLSTTKLDKVEDRLPALCCLVWLLPIPNRDTLQRLSSFLSIVANHAEDTIDRDGNEITGNKMGILNLATIFGPNILHRNKKTNSSNPESQYQVQSVEQAEETALVISVIQNIIEHEEKLFSISSEIHEEILNLLKDADPDAVDFLLRRKAANYIREKSKAYSLDALEDDTKIIDHPKRTLQEFQVNNNNSNESVFEEHSDIKKRNSKRLENKRIHVKSKPKGKECGIQKEISDGQKDENTEPRISSSSLPSPVANRSVSFSDADFRDILGDSYSVLKFLPGQFKNDLTSSTVCKEKSPEEEFNESKIHRRKRSEHTSPDKLHDGTRFRRQAISIKPSSTDTDFREIRKKDDIQFNNGAIFPPRSGICPPNSILESPSCPTCPSDGNKREDYCDYDADNNNNTDGNKIFPNHEEVHIEKLATSKKDMKIPKNIFPGNNQSIREYSHNMGKETLDTNSDDDARPMRKRLPSTLNLRLHHIYGDDVKQKSISTLKPQRPERTLDDIDTNQSLSFKNMNEDLVSRRNCTHMASGSANGRRFSKDDMFLTLHSFRLKREMRKKVNYNYSLPPPPQVISPAQDNREMKTEKGIVWDYVTSETLV